MDTELFLQNLRDLPLEEGKVYIQEHIAELSDHAAVGKLLEDEALRVLYSPFVSLKLAELLIFFGEYVQHTSSHALGLKAKGDALVQIGHFQAAIESLDAAGEEFQLLGDDGNWARSRISWITACASLGRVEEALQQATQAHEVFLRILRTLDVELPISSWSPRALLRPIFASRVMRTQPQFAVRGNNSETAWPRQYKAESVDLSLHLSLTSSGEHMLLGILTSIDPEESVDALEGVPAELYIAPWPLATNGDKPSALPILRTQVDDLGHLVFKPVPAGEYVMVIYLPDRELIVEHLAIE